MPSREIVRARHLAWLSAGLSKCGAAGPINGRFVDDQRGRCPLNGQDDQHHTPTGRKPEANSLPVNLNPLLGRRRNPDEIPQQSLKVFISFIVLPRRNSTFYSPTNE